MTDATTFSDRGVKRLLKDDSEMHVSENAIENLSEYLEEISQDVARRARDAAKHDDRKTIQGEDVEFAISMGA
jgi:histone H3/H4